MQTLFTKCFGLQCPIMGAPMAGASGPALAAAVAEAGGLGFLGAAVYKDGTELRRNFEEAKRIRRGSAHGLGIGLMGFVGSRDLQDTAIELQPHAIWVAFGSIDALAMRVKAGGVPLVVMVQSVQQALHAADLGADAIVAQGHESGGHGASASTTFCFLPEVAAALAEHCAACQKPPVPLIAAGGVTTGRQVAAVLALGADGAVLGTRLVASEECMYSPDMKARYVAAKGTDTHRTRLWDDLGSLPWPDGINGRALHNTFSKENPEELLQQEEVKKELQAKLAEAQKTQDLDVLAAWAGSGVGMIGSIEPAKDLVQNISAEAAATVKKLARVAVSTASCKSDI